MEVKLKKDHLPYKHIHDRAGDCFWKGDHLNVNLHVYTFKKSANSYTAENQKHETSKLTSGKGDFDLGNHHFQARAVCLVGIVVNRGV